MTPAKPKTDDSEPVRWMTAPAIVDDTTPGSAAIMLLKLYTIDA